jgi:uncharacterized protein (TIGR03437 family)
MLHHLLNRRFSLPFACLLLALFLLQQDTRITARITYTAQPTAAPERREFITYQKDAGTATRLATAEESAHLTRGRQVETKPLHAEQSSAPASANVTRDGFLLTFRGTAQLERYPQAKAAFERALTRWQEVFAPEGASFANIEIDIDFGPRYFGQPFPVPGTIGVTNVAEDFFLYSGVLEQLLENSFEPEKARLFSFLPTTLIPTEMGTANSIMMTTGHALAMRLRELTRFRPAMGFSAEASFDFDPRDGIEPGKLDFEAAVLRELGRILGFISRVEDADARWTGEPFITFWDLFRFRAEARADFTPEVIRTEPRALLSGTPQVFFAGGEPIPLSTGRGDGQGGDNPAGAWKDDALTGRYLGMLDPTLATGERGGFTANDLHALRALGYNVNEYATVMEVLSADDGSREETLPLNGTLIVNRLTPARYPATVDAVRVQLPDGPSGAAAGQLLRVVLFADPARTGRPPANPQLLYDRTLTLGGLPAHRMLEIMLDRPVALAAGDLYVGVQTASDKIFVGADHNSTPQGRAFISRDNGASFQPLQVNQQAINVLLRAVCQAEFQATQTPQINALSPAAAPPGGAPIELFIYGDHFEARRGGDFSTLSVVRWNGQPRPTNYINGTLLKATIPASDLVQAGVVRITVFTPNEQGGRESAPVEFNITPQPPAPLLLSLTPDFATPGSEPLALTLRGRNFTARSVARWNGQPRTTNFVNQNELTVSLNVGDFAAAANADVTVFTPNADSQTEGRNSNARRFRVAPCSYKVLVPERPVSSYGGTGAFTLETEPPCPWTLTSETAWLRLRDTGTGRGRAIVSYSSTANTDGPLRRGELKIGGQTVSLRQLARASGSSAANYAQALALDSIGALFGMELANRTQTAERTPLPETLAGAQVRLTDYLGFTHIAPLFYVAPGQINFHVPTTLRLIEDPNIGLGKNARVGVYIDGQLVADGSVNLARINSGLFTSTTGGVQGVAVGLALRIKPDGTQSYEPLSVFDQARNRVVANPIDLTPQNDQVFLILYGTGFRARPSLETVKVTINGTDLEVLYAGPQGELVGLDQLNVRVPRRLVGAGEVRLRFSANETGGSVVFVAFK